MKSPARSTATAGSMKRETTAGDWSPTRTAPPAGWLAGPERTHSHRFAELAAAIPALPPATLILDGEVAIFDEGLISRFERFRKRPEDVASTPPIYMAFYLEGRDLRPLLRLR